MQTLAKWISVRPLCFPFKDLSSPLLTVPMPVLIQVNGWQLFLKGNPSKAPALQWRILGYNSLPNCRNTINYLCAEIHSLLKYYPLIC